ncbi:hypothetical protein [Pseudomonas oryzihabitans]|uniref:hypothetical protein n=1 Tax=Pseudomonas oryzihabitans TaxID=47885 RepID=UPI002895055F|nr:hypothetical protein [Pseudomonas oryzihabitans]MDT3722377.1 hypothetical protein [Pseudomonas oryzihabitans]
MSAITITLSAEDVALIQATADTWKARLHTEIFDPAFDELDERWKDQCRELAILLMGEVSRAQGVTHGQR